MSELKAFESERIYWAVEQVEREAGDIDNLHLDDNLFYIKSEADKVITHQKYKRCLAMVKYCHESAMWLEECGVTKSAAFMLRWQKRWLELAEKFKEAK